MRCFLPDVFKASCKVGEKNRLQSQEANCTLPVGCTGMSLICLEWRRAKLWYKLAHEYTFESTHYMYVHKSAYNASAA